jgi:hypothetical protein
MPKELQPKTNPFQAIYCLDMQELEYFNRGGVNNEMG